MIDLKKFRENPEIYIKGTQAKNVDIDFDVFKSLDENLRAYKQKVEELNARKNVISKELPTRQKNGENVDYLINEVKTLKVDIEQLEYQLEKVQKEFDEMYLRIPNPILDDVPYGKTDEENVEVAKIGKIREFDFQPLTSWDILEKRDLLDTQRSAKVSGSRFFYLRDGMVRLEFAIVNWVFEKLSKKGFRPTMVPQLVKEEAMICTGFFPAEKGQIYSVNPGEDNLFLVGTSEVPLVAQHMDETIDVNNLPLRYIGFSSCFRREAGTYGKDTRGMIRVHQFEKLEMVSIVKPEDSIKEHELILSIEEEIFQELGIPYRRLLICSGDLGIPAAKKYDLEAWFPGMNGYKEITSCSNCTDFQARRGKIKFKNGEQKDFVHTLNGTAVSFARALSAIVENYQTKDLKIEIPQVLKKYFDGEEYI